MDISRRKFIKTTSGTVAIGVAAAGAALQINAAAQQKSGLIKSIDQNSGQSVTQHQPIPSILSVPPGNALLLRAYGIGVQIYTCPVYPTSAAVPHADLIASDKDEGDIVAIHFAGPTWQALDGSSVVGDAANAKHFPAPTQMALTGYCFLLNRRRAMACLVALPTFNDSIRMVGSHPRAAI